MTIQAPSNGDRRRRLASPSGLSLDIGADGAIGKLECGDILVNLFPGNLVEGGPVNLHLRRHGSDGIVGVPLLGPRSPGRLVWEDGRGLALSGVWHDLRFVLTLRLAADAPAWFWHLALENGGDTDLSLDLIHTQDLGLAHYGAVRLNEYYVSQYLDHAPLAHPEHGWAVASRQNLPMGGRHPWCLLGSLGQAAAYATDARQFYGLESRAGRAPLALTTGLPGARLQHEHAMAALQEARFRLAPGARTTRGFFGCFEADHPEVTGAADLAFVARTLALPEAAPPDTERFFADLSGMGEGVNPNANLFSDAPLLAALDLTGEELAARFPGAWRHLEEDADGVPLSFFAGENAHVVLKAKELRVLRPHGQILRTGSRLTPDEAGLTSTAWMAGVFHSMVTQGHVSINRLLSTAHGYLGLFRSHGLRLFVEIGDGWQLLDVPSAFAMTPNGGLWLYRHAGGLIQVRAEAPADCHELRLTVEIPAGPPARFLLCAHLAINGDDGLNPIPARVARDAEGFTIRPIPDCDLGWRFPAGYFRLDPRPGTRIARFGGDELLFSDGLSRHQPFLCLLTELAALIGFRLTGQLVAEDAGAGVAEDAGMAEDAGAGEDAGMGVDDGTDAATGAGDDWRRLTASPRLSPPPASPLAGDLARLGEILPWFAQNALVHYLSPRGLEQYSGGGWGTRDVAQGPVELLLALGLYAPVRDLLTRLFANQNPDGDWPQWFMFFERERNIRPGDSHGDIVFWPLLALGQYLAAAGDGELLDEAVPFFHPDGTAAAEWATIRDHLDRALAVIAARRIPGTALAAYGNGDWNDSLQPLDPAMRDRLCSAWTVTLHHRTLEALATAFRHLGRTAEAESFEAERQAVRADFQRRLIVDGTLAGLVDFETADAPRPLLHPRDAVTGLSHSLLAMVHAIVEGLFTPEQARHHLALIDRHLRGPDGARLFDRPMPYRGGAQRIFQRIESSSFFGREIGLMYTHAHLRHAEALWRHGDAEGFFRALCQANPIGIRALVPAAALRQANCYFSSSDGDFADRYAAEANYDGLLRGEIPLEGGWRVYSSGAGIGLGLILRGLLGLRLERGRLVIDPVLPPALDGLRVERTPLGDDLEVRYRVGSAGCGPVAVWLNEVALPFERGASPYRVGAAELPLERFRAGLAPGGNRLRIDLG